MPDDRRPDDPDRAPGLIDQGPVDEEKDLVAEVGDDEVPDDGDGPRLGRPTSPLVSERVPEPAEEAAMHIVEDDDV